MITVFIVDDHPFVREGLKTFLSTHAEISVQGETADGQSALECMKHIKPDIAIVDLHLPKMNGIQLTKAIKEASLPTQVIILSSFSADDEVIAAIEAGAISYLMKDSPPQKLIEAILAARNGEPTLHPQIAWKLMQKVRLTVSSSTEPLTSKEHEVLAKLVKGCSNKEIASQLHISDTTVKTHVGNILQKLNVSDRTQAVIKALELKLVGDQDGKKVI